MLRTGHADATWFSTTFLALIPTTRVDDVIASVKRTLGDYRTLEFTAPTFVAHFARGTDEVRIHFNADEKIDALLFLPPVDATR